VVNLSLKRETLHSLSSHGLSAIHGATDISFAPDPDGDPAIQFVPGTAIMLTPGFTIGPTVIPAITLATNRP